jgi:hypothetical protein
MRTCGFNLFVYVIYLFMMTARVWYQRLDIDNAYLPNTL